LRRTLAPWNDNGEDSCVASFKDAVADIQAAISGAVERDQSVVDVEMGPASVCGHVAADLGPASVCGHVAADLGSASESAVLVDIGSASVCGRVAAAMGSATESAVVADIGSASESGRVAAAIGSASEFGDEAGVSSAGAIAELDNTLEPANQSDHDDDAFRFEDYIDRGILTIEPNSSQELTVRQEGFFYVS
jgi:hypothetical protein